MVPPELLAADVGHAHVVVERQLEYAGAWIDNRHLGAQSLQSFFNHLRARLILFCAFRKRLDERHVVFVTQIVDFHVRGDLVEVPNGV